MPFAFFCEVFLFGSWVETEEYEQKIAKDAKRENRKGGTTNRENDPEECLLRGQLDNLCCVIYFITTMKGGIMRSTITISVPEQVRKQLDRVSKAEGVSRSDIVRESIRDHLFMRQFRALRRQMLPKAAQQGIFTDQDVFNRIS